MPQISSPSPAGKVWRIVLVALLIAGGMVGSYYVGRHSGAKTADSGPTQVIDSRVASKSPIPAEPDERPRLGALATGTPELGAGETNEGISEIDLAEIEKSLLELGAGDVDGALRELAQQSRSIRSSLAPGVLKFLAQKAPSKCADWAIQNLAGQKLIAGIKPVIDVWIATDPKAALDWLFAKGETTNDILGEHFASKLGEFWKEKAEGFLMSRPPSEKRDQLATSVAQAWAAVEPAAAIEWSLKFRDSLPLALPAALRSWAVTNYSEAESWVKSRQDEEDRDIGVMALSEVLADTEPTKGLALAKEISDAGIRTQHQSMLIDQWMNRAPDVARAWLTNDETLPAEFRRQMLTKDIDVPGLEPETGSAPGATALPATALPEK